jgi:hypothetical protein
LRTDAAFIAAFAAVTLQSGCAASDQGSIPGVASARVAPFVQRAQTRGSLVYVSDAASSFISVFDRNGNKIGRITQGLTYPAGLFVDAQHNLWVANGGDSSVLEYARGGTTPIATFADGSAYTQDVTICPNGDVFVATLLGGITKYTGKKHHLSGSLSYYGGQFQFVTCDEAGNVFATGVVGTNGTVIEFPGGRQKGANMLPISSLGNLGGIKPDNAGNILVSGVYGATVTEYTEAGKPTGVQINTQDGWLDIALTRNGNLLLGSDGAANAGVSVTFPGDKPRVTYRDSFSSVWGVAFDPGQ